MSNSEDLEGDFEKESDPLVSTTKGHLSKMFKARNFWWWQPNAWTVTTFLFAGSLLGYLAREGLQCKGGLLADEDTYEAGFETDWGTLSKFSDTWPECSSASLQSPSWIGTSTKQ
jgi:hypothetical protein